MKNLYSVFAAGVFLCLWHAVGEVPGVISHQGRLTVNGTNYTGLCQFKFALVNAAGDRTFWSHDGSSAGGAEPTGAPVTLPVTRGVFSVNLGDPAVAGMARAIPPQVFTNSEIYLRIWVSDGTGVFQPLSPDRRITSAPYALAAGVLTGNVQTEQLPAGVAWLGSNQSFTGNNVFSGVTDMSNPGNHLAGTFAGDGSGITNLAGGHVQGSVPRAVQFTGNLVGEVTGTQGATVVSSMGGLSASTIVFGALAAVQAESANAPNRLVQRDNSGSFAAGSVTGSFAGNGSGLTNLNANSVTGTVMRALNFTGSLAGDVGGTQSATVVNSLSGVPASVVAMGAQLANSAGSVNMPSSIVRRDSNGAFAAGTVTGTFVGEGSGLTNLSGSRVTGTVARAADFSGALAGDVTGTQTATVVSAIGGVSSSTVVFGALAANQANSDNVANTIVRRDAAGRFSAGTVTARFAGDGSQLTNLNAANLTGSIPPALVESALPAGTMLVSMSAQDSALVSKGYRLAMTVPAPAWANGASVNAPSARSGHTSVWVGQQFIVWGGTIASSLDVNSGAIWHADTDTWETISPVNAPTPRSGHTAVSTGSEMLVWGGRGFPGFLRSGAKFTPAGQLWTTISESGAPAERSGHVAVWTGTRMLIWGGQNDSGLLNDGALYDPVSNQWTPIPAANAPVARIDATAVWTGDRLLLWGGQGAGGTLLQSGAQLTFSGGSPVGWAPITTTGAPLARRWHTAVWTSPRMIIWGGHNGVALADGAAYDPANDTWQPLPGTGAPAARFQFVSAWTGQELLIVGGSNGSVEFSSGSAFDPLTQLWRPLSTSGNPQPRTQAVGAWSGSELVVFGGLAAGQPVAALQRLVPQPVWFFYRKL